MAEAAALIRRHETMKAQRELHVESVWRECFDYTFPLRGNGLTGGTPNPAVGMQGQQARLLDSTAPDAANTLASNIMASLTPSNALWFALDVGNESNEERRWLDDAARLLWENIHLANFDAEGFEVALDIVGAGQAALYVDEDREQGGFAFEQWPLAQCTFASTRADGRIDIVHRAYCLTAEQAVTEFGADKLPEAITRALEKEPSKEFPFLRVIEPRKARVANPRLAKNLPVASYSICMTSKSIVREAGYHEMPVIVPRWLRLAGSVYAVGPMYAALPDVRQINVLKGYELASADIAIAGMWIAEDDGILNPRNIKLGPRKIIIAADVDNMKALQTGANFELSDVMVSKLQQSIRQTLMADILPPPDGPTKTAYEYNVRVDIARKVRAPAFGRLQAEYLSPLIIRCFGIAYRAGVFEPPPESLQGRSFSVRYVSPLARAQKLDEVQAIQGTVQAVAGLAQFDPTAVDLLDTAKVIELTGQGLGAPGAIMRSPQDVAKLRQAKAQAQQQQAQQQAAMQAQAAGMEAGAVKAAGAA